MRVGSSESIESRLMYICAIPYGSILERRRILNVLKKITYSKIS